MLKDIVLLCLDVEPCRRLCVIYICFFMLFFCAFIFYFICFFFFFQAEDGIRDRNVTGVQTCALPICPFVNIASRGSHSPFDKRTTTSSAISDARAMIINAKSSPLGSLALIRLMLGRSEERRVGKECRCRWGRGQ